MLTIGISILFADYVASGQAVRVLYDGSNVSGHLQDKHRADLESEA